MRKLFTLCSQIDPGRHKRPEKVIVENRYCNYCYVSYFYLCCIGHKLLCCFFYKPIKTVNVIVIYKMKQ